MTRPQVTKYTDYRVFLRTWFVWQKSIRPKFSFQTLATEAGFKSKSHLHLVFKGQRDLSPEAILPVAAALKLDAIESQYFENLVRFNQADQLETKSLLFERLSHLAQTKQRKALPEGSLWLFEDWRHLALLELVESNGALLSPHAEESLGTLLRIPMPASQTKESIDRMLNMGLLQRTQGHLRKADHATMMVPDGNGLDSFHRQMTTLAAEVARSEPRSLYTHTLTLSLPHVHLRKINTILARTRDQLVRELEALPGTGDQIVQINLQAFSLSRSLSKGTSK